MSTSLRAVQGSGIRDVVDDVSDVRFVARVFAQACLPYTNPGDADSWVRTNGGVTLALQSGVLRDTQGLPQVVGLPFGLYPRLLLMFFATEATRRKSRDIEIPSMRALLRDLDIAKSSSAASGVADQLVRLLACQVSVSDRRDPETVNDVWWRFASGMQSDVLPNGERRIPHVVTLSEEFYSAVINGPLPVNFKDVQALRGKHETGLALDIYCWLVHRLHRLRTRQYVSWGQLQEQFGGRYSDEASHRWKSSFIASLEKVVAIQPGFGVTWDEKRVCLSPSRGVVLSKGQRDWARRELSRVPSIDVDAGGLRVVHA